ncbi:hypothetical protein AVW09_03080 [Microbacterium sp. T32]|nr:hypothetical protein AVW09_03080 [Microbacterium sp. T32]
MGFGLGAAVCWLLVVLIGTRRFRRTRWLGMRTDAITHSAETWTVAHEAALSWISAAAVAASIASVLGGISWALGASMQAGEGSGLVGLAVGGIGVTVSLWAAVTVGNRAAKEIVRREEAG